MRGEYTYGNALTFTASFVDPSTGQGVSPSDVLLKLRDPNGVEVDVVPIGTAVGVFTASFTPMVAGNWSYRWQGSGAVVAAREGSFDITATDF